MWVDDNLLDQLTVFGTTNCRYPGMDRQLDLPGTTKIVAHRVWIGLPRYQAWIPSWYLLGTTRSCGFTRFLECGTEDWMKVSMALCMSVRLAHVYHEQGTTFSSL
jgi:hypothetical protein